MKRFPRACLLAFLLIGRLGAVQAGETLYNGIVLPDAWPPTRTPEELAARTPQPVPPK
jgi:hypothetical protein